MQNCVNYRQNSFITLAPVSYFIKISSSWAAVTNKLDCLSQATLIFLRKATSRVEIPCQGQTLHNQIRKLNFDKHWHLNQ